MKGQWTSRTTVGLVCTCGFWRDKFRWQALWNCGWLSISSLTASHHNLSPAASRNGGKKHLSPKLVGQSIELDWSHGNGNYRTNWTNYTISPKAVSLQHRLKVHLIIVWLQQHEIEHTIYVNVFRGIDQKTETPIGSNIYGKTKENVEIFPFGKRISHHRERRESGRNAEAMTKPKRLWSTKAYRGQSAGPAFKTKVTMRYYFSTLSEEI